MTHKEVEAIEMLITAYIEKKFAIFCEREELMDTHVIIKTARADLLASRSEATEGQRKETNEVGRKI